MMTDASGPAQIPLAHGGIVARPQLFERLARTERVAEVAAPPGSGKTVLVSSWVHDSGLADHVAWVSIEREERDPLRFWISLLDALRSTRVGSALVRPLTGAPDLDAWEIVEWLLEDLNGLESPIWLVIDDVHELQAADTLRQLELLLLRAPSEMRFVLLSRHDLRLGLHRLRLEGGLTEIRADVLRFSLEEARALFDSAGVELSEWALGLLHERTEGWAAGMRLAALSLTQHPDPERFAAEFSGSERTVAEYLLVEVLDRQPEDVRQLMLRTSVLERMNGALADALTGGSGGEKILRELESANAFVVALDASRTWFRYHHLFGDLLEMELRSSEPDEVVMLHQRAATWFAEHGWPADAVRHAQAAGDWGSAARTLADSWLSMQLSGKADVVHELLGAFPTGVMNGNAELTAMVAADRFALGAFEEAGRQLALAAGAAGTVPPDRHDHLHVTLAILELQLARERGDFGLVVEQSQRLLAPAETTGVQLHVREDFRAMAYISLGIAELWMLRIGEAETHLEQGIALARTIGEPYLEVLGLAHWAFVASVRSYDEAFERAMRAIELARRNGWGEEPVVTMAYVTLGTTMNAQGRLVEAGEWLDHAERAAGMDPQGVTGLLLYYGRGSHLQTTGRLEAAASTYARGLRVAERVMPGHPVAVRMRSFYLQTLARMGDTEAVEAALAAMDEGERAGGEASIIQATLRLAAGDPGGATSALAPLLAATIGPHPLYRIQVFLLEAIARDQLGEADAAETALESALEFAEADGTLLPFLLHPAPALLERHRRHGTAHPALLASILDRLGGVQPTRGRGIPASLPEPLTDRELLVLRFLPTNLSQRDIADELYVAVSTVKTHIHHVYAKLGVNGRREAVERARELGLLASSVRRS